MGEHPDTLYYHTFAPEILVITDADGVVTQPIEIRMGRDFPVESLPMMTTDNRGEPTPADVIAKAIEQFMTYFVVSWYGQKVEYK
jgi:hypothetical protein